MKKNKVFVACDSKNINKVKNIIQNTQNSEIKIGYKFGLEFFNSKNGRNFISKIKNKIVFADLKLHDIPNTVKKTIQGLSLLPITMLTIHTSGGKDMMMAAMEATSDTQIKVFGVTALTSLSDDEIDEIFQRTSSEQVNAMLDLAESAGIDGIVCSPHELKLVKKRDNLLSITPGIRLQDSNDDQKRVMTPKEAINLGADFLVIGRPITKAENIGEALDKVFQNIS